MSVLPGSLGSSQEFFTCLKAVRMNINPADHETRRMHLPRIMCLHGGGTNTRIFRAQCRVLERMLRPHFRLCYAQAPFFSQAGPDVQSVYSDFGPFRAWLRWSPDNAVGEVDGVSEEIIAAIDSAMEEDNSYGADGEWVGLLGFSQGAKICASILHSQQERARGQHHIPTIHVHGLNDPNLHLHRRLFYEHCKGNSASLIEWDGGHRVPVKTGHVRTLVDEVLAVFQRTRQRAGTRQKAGFRVGFGEA
jgi:predicted esterase